MSRFDLTCYNTLRLSASADQGIKITQREQLLTLIEKRPQAPLLVMGEGSNMVFASEQVSGIALLMRLTGVRQVAQTRHTVTWRVAAGESWHGLVQTSLCAGLCGLENLSLIPGTVGAAPVQNIGAYGVELSERVVQVEVMERESGAVRFLTPDACQFGYRSSLFKAPEGASYIILSVDVRLDRYHPTRYRPQLGYGQLASRVAAFQAGGLALTPSTVSRAVMAIRREKLPDPNRLPNVGSFFKNPTVSRAHYERLRRRYSTLVAYPVPQQAEHYKLAAGWLIEQAGLKGYRMGPVAVHKQQALVLVNCAQEPTSGAAVGRKAVCRGRDLLALAEHIQAVVMDQYGVALEVEPKVVV